MPLANDLNDLAGLELSELEAILTQRGSKPFRAGQIFRWIHRRGSTSFDQMTDLSLALRKQLADACVITTPSIERRETSEDGTEKFLLRLKDDCRIESVFIPDTPRLTFCVSTQVGCAMRCAFCLTGKMGLTRNLTAGEIAGQVRVLAHTLGLVDTSFNPGFPFCLPRMVPLYTRESPIPRNFLRRTIVQLRRPSPQPPLTCNRLEPPTFRAFLRHRSTLVAFLRQAGFVALAARQPPGTGSAQILRSMSPNSRRVRCPSANRSQ